MDAVRVTKVGLVPTLRPGEGSAQRVTVGCVRVSSYCKWPTSEKRQHPHSRQLCSAKPPLKISPILTGLRHPTFRLGHSVQFCATVAQMLQVTSTSACSFAA